MSTNKKTNDDDSGGPRRVLYYVWAAFKDDWDFHYQGEDIKEAEKTIGDLLKEGYSSTKIILRKEVTVPWK